MSYQKERIVYDRDELIKKGPIKMTNGTQEGTWNKAGERHGTGTQTQKDGSQQTGSWKDDKRNGQGK